MRNYLLLWLLSYSVWADSRLDQLLRQQRQEYAQAVITGGFHDPRGVSRYRSRPGVHSGYDIAMPAGSRARIAWPGRVTAIIPWADGEWGVQVQHEDGTSATYGHVVPAVESGQALKVGQVVGYIARDHLDVKMRDSLGVLFDYADSTAVRFFEAPQPPSARALAWQERWRAFSRRPPGWLSTDQKKQLVSQGLSVAAKSGPEVDMLLAEYAKLSPSERSRLSWTVGDRASASQWNQLSRREQKLMDLGFVAPNRVKKIGQIATLWSEVLGSKGRTVSNDQSSAAGRSAVGIGLAEAESPNGGL